jgi:hypothetical protein
MPYAHWWMDCQNPDCGSPIQLPHPTIAATGSSQAAWPRDGWKQSFLCFHCGRVHEYSHTNVRHCLEATQNPYELIPYGTHCIRFDCSEENCGILIKTHVVADSSTTKEEIAGSCRRWSFQYNCASYPEEHVPKPPDPMQIEVLRSFFPR